MVLCMILCVYHCVLCIYCWQKKIGSQLKHFLFWLRGECQDLADFSFIDLPSLRFG